MSAFGMVLRFRRLELELSRRLSPRGSGEANREDSEGQCNRRSFFGELTEHHFRNSQFLTLDELDDRMLSISVIATRWVGPAAHQSAPSARPPVRLFGVVHRYRGHALPSTRRFLVGSGLIGGPQKFATRV